MKTNWLALLALSLAPAVYAADKPTFTTVEAANAVGPDYALQGEYAGEKLGAQIIALSDNKFRAVFHPGGLPGAGWDKKTKVEIPGALTGEKVTFTGPEGGWTATVSGETLTGATDKGDKFTLKKTSRVSPTMGAKAPDGAVVLFDGTSADAWAGGHMDERKLLFAGPKSKQSFTNFTLHVEFMLPFKPHGRGQDRGNSGVYLQDRYEVQVLDSFGLKGENNECGGIYTKAKPSENMCFPPLTWQTYDIEFTTALYGDDGKKTKNAVATIKHNGVIIHDKLEINGSTGGGKKEDASGGQIQLQGHGNPVFYRNVWIVPK